MRVKLKGVNTVKKRLSDGSVARYHYFRATGARLEGEPGSPEFLASYARAEQQIRDGNTRGFIAGLVRDYMRSPEFRTQLAETTQREYKRKLWAIEEEFGDMPVAALNNPRVRAPFMEWRNRVAEVSGLREADYRLSVTSAMLSWAVQNGQIDVNYIKGFRRLYRSDRTDVIWQAADIEAFMANAPLEMQRALILALHTGLRQGDILKLCWTNYDGQSLTLSIGKNGRGGLKARPVSIPCTQSLRTMLDGMERTQAVILTTATGRPFTKRVFWGQWREAMKAAGMEGSPLHFHDLRGTAITMLAEAGCSIPQIVSITQHSLATATRILDVYMSRTRHLANEAIARFENASATDSANRLQTAAPKRAGERSPQG